MARILISLFAIASLLSAEDRWHYLQTGPFQLYSNGSDKTSREAITQLEQFRYTLGHSLGRDNLDSRWPIRVLVAKGSAGVTPLALGRDSYIAAFPNGVPPSSFFHDLALLFIEQNAPQLAPALREGLASLMSTIEISGPKIQLGAPPAASARTKEWALLQLLATDPRYSGRLRILLSNLAQGADPRAAYKNAFEKTDTALAQETTAYLQAGHFGEPAFISGKVMLEKEYNSKPLLTVEAAAAKADEFLAAKGRENEASQAYGAVVKQFPERPEGYEGLGELAIRSKDNAAALRELTEAAKHGSKNARSWAELASLQTDLIQARASLKKAAELAPHWAEPFAEMARKEAIPAARIPMLESALKLEPRNTVYWRELAVAQEGAGQFDKAGKSWATAETTATTEEEKETLRQQRATNDQQRFDQEREAKRREAEERERDIQRVRNESLARVRATEARVNKELQGSSGTTSTEGAVPYRALAGDMETPGTLLRVDCAQNQAKLLVQTAGQRRMQLVVTALDQLVVSGKQTTLSCGPQQPAPKVLVRYTKKSGEVASIDFP